jgi:hypothetical protein
MDFDTLRSHLSSRELYIMRDAIALQAQNTVTGPTEELTATSTAGSTKTANPTLEVVRKKAMAEGPRLGLGERFAGWVGYVCHSGTRAEQAKQLLDKITKSESPEGSESEKFETDVAKGLSTFVNKQAKATLRGLGDTAKAQIDKQLKRPNGGSAYEILEKHISLDKLIDIRDLCAASMEEEEDGRNIDALIKNINKAISSTFGGAEKELEAQSVIDVQELKLGMDVLIARKSAENAKREKAEARTALDVQIRKEALEATMELLAPDSKDCPALDEVADGITKEYLKILREAFKKFAKEYRITEQVASSKFTGIRLKESGLQDVGPGLKSSSSELLKNAIKMHITDGGVLKATDAIGRDVNRDGIITSARSATKEIFEIFGLDSNMDSIKVACDELRNDADVREAANALIKTINDFKRKISDEAERLYEKGKVKMGDDGAQKTPRQIFEGKVSELQSQYRRVVKSEEFDSIDSEHAIMEYAKKRTTRKEEKKKFTSAATAALKGQYDRSNKATTEGKAKATEESAAEADDDAQTGDEISTEIEVEGGDDA